MVEEFEQAGSESTHYGVLAILSEGRGTQATIADALDLDRSQLVGVLDDARGNGLVERRRDPNDRRRHAVSITAEGKSQLVKLRSVVKRIEESFLEPLGEDARKALHETLVRVACNFDPRYARPA